MQNRRVITSVLAFWIQCTGTVYQYEYVLLLHVVEDLFSKVCESFQNLTVIFGRTFDLLSSFFFCCSAWILLLICTSKKLQKLIKCLQSWIKQINWHPAPKFEVTNELLCSAVALLPITFTVQRNVLEVHAQLTQLQRHMLFGFFFYKDLKRKFTLSGEYRGWCGAFIPETGRLIIERLSELIKSFDSALSLSGFWFYFI